MKIKTFLSTLSSLALVFTDINAGSVLSETGSRATGNRAVVAGGLNKQC